MTMSDRIAVMRAGRIEQLGPPEELYERPTTDFVAGFLGVSNLLDGEVTERGDRFAAIRLPDGTVLRAPSGSLNGSHSVRVGVRPEKIHLHRLDDPVAANALEGTVIDASFIGVSTHYLVRTEAAGEVAAVVQNLQSHRFAAGDRVRVAWEPQHTFVISVTTFDESRAPVPSGEGETDV